MRWYPSPVQQMVPQDFVLQFWNEDKATNAGLIPEAIGLLLGPKGAGVSYNAALILCEIWIYAPSEAPRGLYFYKIAH